MGISDISQSRSWPQGKRSYKLKLQQPVFKVGGDIKSRILMLEWLKVGRKSILFASVLRLWCFRHTEDWGLLRLSQLLGLHSFGDTGWRGGQTATPAQMSTLSWRALAAVVLKGPQVASQALNVWRVHGRRGSAQQIGCGSTWARAKDPWGVPKINLGEEGMEGGASETKITIMNITLFF